MREFINVPVPSELVTEVMAFIAEHNELAPAAAPSSVSGPGRAFHAFEDGDGGAVNREWTREQFEMLRESKASSVKKFAEVLTLLAGIAPQPMTVDEIGEHLGTEGITLQKKFGPATRWMRNNLGSDIRWPIHFPGGQWALSEHNAALWKNVAA